MDKQKMSMEQTNFRTAQIINTAVGALSGYYEYSDLENILEATDKQVAKKVKTEIVLVFYNTYCPRCHHLFTYTRKDAEGNRQGGDWQSSYCPKCGQKLDWSEWQPYTYNDEDELDKCNNMHISEQDADMIIEWWRRYLYDFFNKNIR